MLKLRVKQSTLEYYGFFIEPAFDLMGDFRALVKFLYKTFQRYNVSLGSFRFDGDSQDISSTAITVKLGLLGNFKLKFDQVYAISLDPDDEQLVSFFEMLVGVDEHLRGQVSNLSFKSHAFFYNSHCELLEGAATEFLRSLPSSGIPVPGEDLGSGVTLNWRDESMDAKVSLSIDHSLQVPGGLFINHRVILERDQVDYIPLAVTAQQLLRGTLVDIGLEFEE